MTIKQPIDSSRYTVHEINGKGCWGTVYHATDKLTNREVAIKVLEPTELAQGQMQHRGLNEKDVFMKEALWLAPLRHVVPRTLELDQQGKPFIVMPFYSTFLSDVFAERAKPQEKQHYDLATNSIETKHTPARFTLEEIIRLSKDLAMGLHEIHKTYHIAHCDIKPDNLAVDEEGRVLFADMGTSTVASRYSEDPRDNMGFPYTRPPWLFHEGTHPTREADVFAVGSLMYKMFTGKYILEEQIDACVSAEDVRKLMEKFENRHQYGSHATSTYYRLVDAKMSNPVIPAEFCEFLRACFFRQYQDGTRLQQGLENTIEEYKRNLARKDVMREFAKSAVKKIGTAFAVGAISTAAVIGGLWIKFYAPPPDFALRADLESQAETRPVDKSEIILLTERNYPPQTITPGQTIPGEREILAYSITEKKEEAQKNIAGTIAYELLRTALDKEVFLPYESMFKRWRQLKLAEGQDNYDARPLQFFERTRTLVTHALGAHQVRDKAVDLEDAVVATLYGNHKLQQAQKYANSGVFEQYSKAVKDGKPLFTEQEQAYLKESIRRITTALPERVRLESDWTQPVPDGTARANVKE